MPSIARAGLTCAEVAQSLGLCTRTVRELVRSGDLVAFRLGRSVRIRPEDLEALIEERRSSTTHDVGADWPPLSVESDL